jgi:hypothetical protein
MMLIISAKMFMEDLLLLEHKYDEYMPVSLLRARAMSDLLDWEEAKRVIQQLAESE